MCHLASHVSFHSITIKTHMRHDYDDDDCATREFHAKKNLKLFKCGRIMKNICSRLSSRDCCGVCVFIAAGKISFTLGE